ncbi:MAG: cupin domain-containing protein [Nitrospinota bacterium]
MPFYKISAMPKEFVDMGKAEMQTAPGELMKAGVVTYPAGGGPPPHYHPNEEQFLLVMGGKANMILGEEVRLIGPGDLVHIPRNVRHGIRIAEAPFVFFTVKSPAGDGTLNQDYNRAKDAEEALRRLAAT